jgi:outer membrane lipoprotein-sorting protein
MKSLPALFVVCLLCFACLSGCGIPRPQTDPALDAQAHESAEKVRNLNQEIVTSKGTGRLRVESTRGVQTFQMAWAARAPDRVRLTFTAMASPVETIVADGKAVTFTSHTGRHKPHTTTSSDPDLESFTGVPLMLSDLIRVLLGQIPIQRFSDAWFSSEDRSKIQVHRKLTTRFQELILASDQPLKALRLKNRQEDIRYEIQYHEFDRINDRQIPVDLTISDGKGQRVRISITRFWPDPPVEESVFQLTPFGS